MIERIAQVRDEREAMDFDRIRAAFIREASRHMDQRQGVVAVERERDSYFWFLWEQMMLAAHTGRPAPPGGDLTVTSRGGNWIGPAYELRAGAREGQPFVAANGPQLGFRCVRTAR